MAPWTIAGRRRLSREAMGVRMHLPAAVALLTAACISAQPGATQAPGKDPCAAPRCEIEAGPLACSAGQFCDMYRNQCVAPREGPDRCAGVECPRGSACVPLVGRCGAPAGPACYDMGTTWWTGRDQPSGQPGSEERTPAPVVIEVHNTGAAPIYFDASWQQPPRFDVIGVFCGRERRLDIPENEFCPCRCPREGPPRCGDCSQPPPAVQRLNPGAKTTVKWSGAEAVGTRRICDQPQGAFCTQNRAALPGAYTLEVCAYPGATAGQPDSRTPGRLRGATPTGQRECRRVRFEAPAKAPIIVRLGG